MKISAKGRYGLAAMAYLAANYAAGTPITIISISEKLGISKIYLEQVFSLLKRAQLVISIKGSQGGYQLAKAPRDISAYDILSAIELSLMEKTASSTTGKTPGSRSLKISAASSAFSTAASTGEERTAPAMTISLSPTICTGSRMNLIFRNFRRECSGLCASTQTTQTITESVRQKAWRQGRSRRKSFASIWFRRGVFWYFAALSQFPVRHPKRMAKKPGKW